MGTGLLGASAIVGGREVNWQTGTRSQSAHKDNALGLLCYEATMLQLKLFISEGNIDIDTCGGGIDDNFGVPTSCDSR